jgi:hypothetical protein
MLADQRFTRRRGVVLLLSLAIGLAAYFSLGSSSAAALDRLSSQGARTPVTAGMKLQLRGAKVQAKRVFVLGTRNGRRFYRIEIATGSSCFAVGRASAPRSTPFGSVFCANGGRGSSYATASLPSQRPVLAWASVEGTQRGVRKLSLLSMDGFATDGVATVEFRDASDVVVASTTVSGNIFSFSLPNVPSGSGHLVAKDSHGNTVYTETF